MDAKAQMGQMDEQIKRMQALHDKLTSAKTPEERQKLMAEQRASMQQGIRMMSQMMQGGGMMSGGMMGQQQPQAPSDSNAQLQLMGKRMDMMQMMMQSMMDQQGMMGGPRGSGVAPKK